MTNGHTHFFLIGDDNNKFTWGDEAKLKFDLAKRYLFTCSLTIFRISVGRSKFGGNKPCKIVTVLLGDNPNCQKDIELVTLILFLNLSTLVSEPWYPNSHPGG